MPLIQTAHANSLSRNRTPEPPTGLTPADLGLPSRFTHYRPGQDRLALDIAASDRRVDLLSAATGVGKSLIVMSVAQLLGARTLYLIGTKSLQTQVLSDFASIGAKDIRGRANYRCAQYQTCDDPDRFDHPCAIATRGQCPYVRAVDEAKGAEIVITNYAYWMALARADRADDLGLFDLLIGDEADTIEEWLTGVCTVEIPKGEAKLVLNGIGMPEPSFDSATLRNWASAAQHAVKERLSEGVESHERRARYRQLLRSLKDVISTSDRTAWAVEVGRDKTTVSPVRPAEFAERYLFRSVPKIVLTSATLTEDTARYLGISSADYNYHEVAEGFDPRRRPFIFVPTTRVDFRMGEGDTRIWMNKIDKFIGTRLDRKGIIHAVSYSRARDIVSRSKYSDAMMTHSTHDARQVIDEFKRADAPAILVSPAVETGFDFPDSECRWQVVTKVPFVDGRSALIKARKSDDANYVNYLAAKKLVQMVGRGTRSADDFCECIAPDTPVLRDDLRWIAAENLNEGDRLLAVEENGNGYGVRAPGASARRRWTWSFVEKSKVSRMPRMEVILEDRTVICTPNHQWLVFGRGPQIARMLVWRRTDELTADDKLIVALPVWEDSQDWLSGWLAGFYDGEGCLVQRHGKRNPNVTGVVAVQSVGLTAEFAKKMHADCGFNCLVVRRNKPQQPHWKRQEYFRIGGGLTEALRFLGQVRPQRLLDKFMSSERGEQLVKRGLSRVERVVRLSDGPICSLQTSSKTYIAAGLVAHNTAIFDDHFLWFRNRAHFPHWFRSAWVQSKEIPQPLDVSRFS